ncbi:MAG TPA: GNAT family N-acetyltransferase [Desulfobacteraceae bacterium]|nr:GNAT family N-acetyltransferase [Desulfobacteraceae bacterium]|tara:strand:- start:1178 stop:1645 length:468 start_codon:yes stop_codon:yes gene_type:complete
MEITITKAIIDDAPEILALQKSAYQSEALIYRDMTLPPLVQTLEELQSEFSTAHVLKATFQGRIVGSVRASLDGDICRIGRLIVSPDCQGMGIGTRLMAAIENAFCQAKKYSLFTGDKSHRNIALYQRLGYDRSDTQRISNSLTLVFMEKHTDGI